MMATATGENFRIIGALATARADVAEIGRES